MRKNNVHLDALITFRNDYQKSMHPIIKTKRLSLANKEVKPIKQGQINIFQSTKEHATKQVKTATCTKWSYILKQTSGFQLHV